MKRFEIFYMLRGGAKDSERITAVDEEAAKKEFMTPWMTRNLDTIFDIKEVLE